jgi:hypothetical protein
LSEKESISIQQLRIVEDALKNDMLPLKEAIQYLLLYEFA